MVNRDDLVPYEGREHAKTKHELLNTYITRYAMIIGQSVPSLAFVDCFSGPWKSARDDMSDTSFGLTLNALRGCASALEARFGRRPEIRALWLEADAESFEVLSAYAGANSAPGLRIEAVHGRFEEEIDRIVRFVGEQSFALIFVDPKGYTGLIDPDVLAPLLRIARAELLINYMWGHIKYAFGRKDEVGHVDNMRRLFGAHTDRLFALTDPDERAQQCLIAYESELRRRCSGTARNRLRVLSYPINDTHGQQHVKYYLVHTTHSPKGLTTFAEQCDEADWTKIRVFHIVQQVRRDKQLATIDLFADQVDAPRPVVIPATQPWLDLLQVPGAEAVVNLQVWADLLEDGRCLPSALLEGFKELRDRGVIENASAKRARPKRHVNYEKDELVRRLK